MQVITIRLIDRDEPPLALTLWFHMLSAVFSVVPLTIGKPAYFSMPEGPKLAAVAIYLVLAVLTAFAGQYFLTSAFQLLPSGKANALNYLQVGVVGAARCYVDNEGVTWMDVLELYLVRCSLCGYAAVACTVVCTRKVSAMLLQGLLLRDVQL